MTEISREDARTVLEPYHAAIYRAVQNAWSIWKDRWSQDVPSALGRDRSNALSSLVDQQIRDLLGAADGIVLVVKHERVLAVVRDRLVLSNKQFLNGALDTRNNPTATSQAFDSGEQIEGIPRLPRVCAGPKLNHLKTEIDGVFVKALQADAWYYPIGHTEPLSQVIPFPGRSGNDGSPRIVPKESTVEDGAEHGREEE